MPDQHPASSHAHDGPSIEFEGVSFAYRDGSPALDGVDLVVGVGEFVAVLGANGSGKSTLARHVNGLLQPNAGQVRVGGLSTSDPIQCAGIRRRVGMVFQNPDDQTVAPLVRDDVAFGPENLGVPPDQIAARVDEALDAVDMREHADEEVAALSGGQKQLVAIAGALAMHPDVLVLDEPGSMLDVRGRRAVMRIAHELNASGMTIVLVTHFVEDALGVDRVVVLDAGRVALDGPPAQTLVDAGRLRALGIEPPFPVELACALRARGVDVQTTLGEQELKEELCRLYLRV